MISQTDEQFSPFISRRNINYFDKFVKIYDIDTITPIKIEIHTNVSHGSENWNV